MMRAILVTFILLAPSIVGAGAAQSEPRYEIAFASFGPNNADLFLADSNGENHQPFLPHAGFALEHPTRDPGEQSFEEKRPMDFRRR